MNQGQGLSAFSGSNLALPYVVTRPGRVRMRFISDASTTRRGFVANVYGEEFESK